MTSRRLRCVLPLRATIYLARVIRFSSLSLYFVMMTKMELSDTEASSDPRQTTLMDEIQRATKSPEHADSMVALIGSTALNRMEKDDAETRATKMHRCERMQLSLYKLLEYWAAEEANDCPALAACKIIDIYINVKHRRRDTATAKRELPVIMIGNWQNMHKMKYGVHFRPNFA